MSDGIKWALEERERIVREKALERWKEQLPEVQLNRVQSSLNTINWLLDRDLSLTRNEHAVLDKVKNTLKDMLL